jgi:plasmid maintenance system antidote protein VapI
MSEPYFGLESPRHLTFRDLQNRLILFVVTKIRNGEFTERGLARVLGVSQPQLHNVLKGARPLKPAFADCLLEQFDIGILDLVQRAELSAQLEVRNTHVKLWAELTEHPDQPPRQ